MTTKSDREKHWTPDAWEEYQKLKTKDLECQTKMQELVDAVKENHQWHIDYDDYGGYPGSYLEDINLKVLAQFTSGQPAQGVMVISDEEMEKAIIEVLKKHEQEFERDTYYGSSPGVDCDDYEVVAAESVKAIKSIGKDNK